MSLWSMDLCQHGSVDVTVYWYGPVCWVALLRMKWHNGWLQSFPKHLSLAQLGFFYYNISDVPYMIAGSIDHPSTVKQCVMIMIITIVILIIITMCIKVYWYLQTCTPSFQEGEANICHDQIPPELQFLLYCRIWGDRQAVHCTHTTMQKHWFWPNTWVKDKDNN